MTDTTNRPVARKFWLPRWPEQLTGLMFMSMPQTIISGVTVLITALTFRVGSGSLTTMALVIATLAAGASLAFAKIAGHPLYFWGPIAVSYFFRQARGDDFVVDKLKAREIAGAGKPPPPAFRRLIKGFKVIPVPFRGGQLAVLHNARAQTYAVCITAAADTFLMKDPLDQVGQIESFGEILDACAAADSVITAFSWFKASVLTTTVGHERWYMGLSPGITAEATEGYADLIELASREPGHEITIMIETNRRRALKDTGSKRVHGKKAEELIIDRLIEALTGTVESLIQLGAWDIVPLSPSMYAKQIRFALDPYARIEASLDADARMQERVIGNGDLSRLPDPPSAAEIERSTWPSAWEEDRKSVTADGTRHVVLVAEEYPSTGVAGTFLRPLLNSVTCPVRVAWRGRHLSTALAERALMMHANTAKSEDESAAQGGVTLHLSKRRRHLVREAQREELADNHTLWAWTMFIDVGGYDDASLRKNVAAVYAAARACGITLRPAYLRMAEAELQCLPMPTAA
jgi:hypothetical protein